MIVTREGVSLTGAGSGNKRVVLIATWDELDEIVRASHAGQVSRGGRADNAAMHGRRL